MEQHDLGKKKKLRTGFTTGTCAAAAAKAAATMLLTGEKLDGITIKLPIGIVLSLPLVHVQTNDNCVSCAIKKDSGDDPDITKGFLIYATVSRSDHEGITIEGGEGIGRVTKPGLACKVGEAAINPVPKQMIVSEVGGVCSCYSYTQGLNVTISVPEGKNVAQKTFNPRLGIVDGISILGTTGIVEPMSKKAWTDTVYLEMKQQGALGNRNLIICPGNYGEDFIQKTFRIHLNKAVKCSNFIGEALDFALELGVESLLLIGHAGKLIKLGAGIMNTHSKVADARMEVLAAHAALNNAPVEDINRIMSCNTTEEAALVLRETGLCQKVFKSVMSKIDYYVQNRVDGGIKTAVVLFSNELGVLGKTQFADELIKLHQDSGLNAVKVEKFAK